MAANTAPTFISRGKVVTDINGGSQDVAASMVLLPDGRILVAGASSPFSLAYDFAVVRYNANGTLDTTFDGDGRLVTAFGGGLDEGLGVVLQSDGKFLVAGRTEVAGRDFDFALARYNANGSLDTTFSGDGKLTTDILHFDVAFGVAVQSDGKIVLAGYADDNFNPTDFVVVRYNANGSLDTTFDGDGKVVTDFSGSQSSDMGTALVIQPDGKIVVAGSSNSGSIIDFAVARYNSNGSLDTSFDGDGKATTTIFEDIDGLGTTEPRSSLVNSVTLQSDGKILVAGTAFLTSGSDFALVRYNPDGSVDTTFSGDGQLTLPVGISSDDARSVTLQADGKILVAGYGFGGPVGGNDLALVRLNTDGSLDTSFGGDGIVMTDFGNMEIGTSVKVQTDGKILVAGFAQLDNPDDLDFAVVRYNTDGSVDATFGPGVNTLGATPFYVEGQPAVVLDGNVEVFDAELAAQGHYGGASLRLERHGGANAHDVFSATGDLLGPLTQGAALTYDGVTVGTVTTNSGGVLVLTFDASATQDRVNGVMRAIGYSNASNAPPPSVQIDYVFSDGNSGAQGTGGALAALGSITVNVTPITDVYIWTELANGQVLEFDPEVDVLQFGNDNIFASDVSVAEGSTIFSYAGKTVTLLTDVRTLTTANVTFPVSLTKLIVGDDTTATGQDDAANMLMGGAGPDHLLGLGGNDFLFGGAGADALNGGAGSDYARYDTALTGVTVDLTLAVAATGDAAGDTFISIENLLGSPFADALYGDSGANTLQGRDGNDTIVGRAGNDALLGGNGNDTLLGGTGNDNLNGGADNDSLFGDDGADTLLGGDGIDSLYGGAGADALNGGAGVDYARYDTALAAVTVDLTGAVAAAGEAIGDTFSSIENLSGSPFADTLYGDAAANVLQGRAGNDTLLGRASIDSLFGGAGNDLLYGQEANDTLNGELGRDSLFGGAGADSLTGGADADLFYFVRGEAHGDRLTDFDGQGAALGDRLMFAGYGAGATFVNLNATDWQINSGDGVTHEIIKLLNSASVHASDFTFV